MVRTLESAGVGGGLVATGRGTTDLFIAPGYRPRVVDACVRLIDEEVAAKSGLSGMAVKGAYAVVKKI